MDEDEIELVEESPSQEELEALLLERKAQIEQQIDMLGQTIASKRKDAIDYRKQSGVEDEWTEAENAYQGVDSANRDEFKYYKSPSPEGSPIGIKQPVSGRSTILLNITGPYVDAAAAKVADMLLPTDDKNWAIKPTPIPEPVMPPAAQSAPTAQPPLVQMQGAPNQSLSDDDKAKGASKQLEDWLSECNYNGEMRKVIEDCARIGVGVMKGPFPVKKKQSAVINQNGQVQMVMETKVVPASRRIDPWNFYPAPGCGESIHQGSYVFERDSITGRGLRDLKGLPGYLDDRIEQVLEEGPGKKVAEDRQGDNYLVDDDNFEVWYFHGFVGKDDLIAANVELPEDCSGDVPAVLTLVNDTVIKANLNPLDSGEFPYDTIPWRRKAGSWTGTGIATQLKAPQKILTAATRNMMDNAGVAGGPIIGIKSGVAVPADGEFSITPRKMFLIKEDFAGSIRDAIDAIVIPDVQASMQGILQFALKMAEDVTNMPLLMQGQQGKAPDTVGVTEILSSNANVVLRRIAKLYDDNITTGQIGRYYRWLLMYGDDPTIKGDFQIETRGSSALLERALLSQQLMQMGNLVMNPAFGLSPSKWVKELLASQRLDVKRFELDEEEQQALQQQAQPMPPQIQAAQIRAQADIQKVQMQGQIDLQRAKMEQDRDLLFAQAQTQQTQIQASSRREELMLKREIAYLELQVKKGISVDDNKVKLATKAAELRQVKDLAMMHAPASALPKPPVEPVGRASPGNSFQE